MSNTVQTKPFRAAYPFLFEPRPAQNGKDEYSVVAVFPKDADLSELRAAVTAAIVAQWGPDKKKWPKNLKDPIRDQSERGKEDENTGKMTYPRGYEPGAFFVSFKSRIAPSIVDARLQPITDPSEIYAGVWMKARVQAVAFNHTGNQGVSFWLVRPLPGEGNVQKLRDDSMLGGGGQQAPSFTAVETDSDTAEGIFK